MKILVRCVREVLLSMLGKVIFKKMKISLFKMLVIID